MPLFGALGLALAVLLLAGGSRRQGSVVRQRRQVGRVLLIGDSFAVGLERPLKALAQGLPFEAHTLTSTTIPYWAGSSTLAGIVDRFQPTHVLVSLGTNDEKGQILSQDQGAIEQLLATLRRGGAVVAWIGPPALPFPRAGISALAQSRSDRYFPSEMLSIPRTNDGMGGGGLPGLHPTSAGYAAWADAIWRWLLS